MDDSPLFSFALLALAVVWASCCGIFIARRFHWSQVAQAVGLPYGVGLALAPFIVGLSSVFALAVTPGAPPYVHLIILAAVLTIISLTAKRLASPTPSTFVPPNFDAWAAIWHLLLGLFLILLIYQTATLPLTQNDSLEYATVSRLIFETGSLYSYPAIDPIGSTSGFYGPWTHPPLYVALIYFTNILQGHADSPGLLRAIAPWSLIAATLLVYMLGRIAAGRCGVWAAIVFVSTPLLFLGASSALLDPITVWGMTTLIAVITGIDEDWFRRSLLIGAILGIAMWTHSQAILFPAYAIAMNSVVSGISSLRRVGAETGLILLTALCISAFPFLRNIAVFGSPISDQPAVFAMPKLAWSEYFGINRGYDSAVDIVQYGVLKGWFALEAYGPAFWLMLVGILLASFTILVRQHQRSALLSGNLGPSDRIVFGAIAIVLLHHAGVAASALLGVDLMYRTERYLLVLMPCVATIAAVAIRWALNLQPSETSFALQSMPRVQSNRIVASILAAGLTLSFTLQFAALAKYRTLASSCEPTQSIATPVDLSLCGWNAYHPLHYLRQESPPSALVLSLKPADMYYSARKMISFLDPRLLSFYRSEDRNEATMLLRKLGVTHIHLPDYALPPVYRSMLQAILADPMLTRLTVDSAGYQLYSIRSPNSQPVPLYRVKTGGSQWQEQKQIILGGRQTLLTIKGAQEKRRIGDMSTVAQEASLFQRERSTLLYSGPIAIPVQSTNVSRQFLVDLRLDGYAYPRFHLQELDSEKKLIARRRLGDLAVSRDEKASVFLRRFVVNKHTRFVRIEIERRGYSKLRLNGFRLYQINSVGSRAKTTD